MPSRALIIVAISMCVPSAKAAADDGSLAGKVEIASAVFVSVVDDTPSSAARIVYVTSDTLESQKIISAFGAPKHIKLMPGDSGACEMRDRHWVDSKSGLPCAVMHLDVTAAQETSATVRYQWKGPKGGITIMTFSLEKRGGRWLIVSRKINLAS